MLALACDDAPRAFDLVSLALSRLQAELGNQVLRSLDLIFTPPLKLICVLHLAPGRDQELIFSRIEEIAEAGQLRVLDRSGTLPAERDAALREAEQRLSIREPDIRVLAPALERFRRYLGLDAAAAGGGAGGLALSVYYPAGDVFRSRYSRNSLFIESEALPEIGQRCRLSLSTGSGQGPIQLSARVVHTLDVRTAALTNTRPGFGVALLLPPDERDPFESFLIALERGTPWPDRSGRRHERFPIRLRVVYEHGGETRREYTDNLSRGGLFINGFDPPPRSAALELQLFAPGRAEPVDFKAKVTHTIGAEEAAARGVQSGAGVVFVEDAMRVRAKVEALLAGQDGSGARRVLIADDDQFFRSVLGNALRLGGFEVLEASDGTQAASMLLEDGVAVEAILIDLYMPGMTGAELLAELRRSPNTAALPAVVVSGAALTDVDRASLRTLGADDVLSKSLSPESVLERLDAAVSRRKQRT